MDLEHQHPTPVHALRACTAPDARDLVAVAGEHTVEVLQVSDTALRRVAAFHVGARITALAWSPRTVSPASSDAWAIELVAAGADFGLHLLTHSPSAPPHVFPFGGGLSGHHGTVTDIAFSGGWDADAARYVATVSDDAMLIVWDLLPPTPRSHSPSPSPDLGLSPPRSDRAQPTAYPIPFAAPLSSLRAHPGTGTQFLAADAAGGVFLVDWRADPNDADAADALRHSSVVELVAPAALAAAALGSAPCAGSSVDWRADAIDIIGGVFGTQFALWDIAKLRGGAPLLSGRSFPDGPQIFRWCPTHPDFFAIASTSARAGAVVHVHNCAYAQAAPTALALRPRPHHVRALDFLSLPGIPRLAAAVASAVLVFPIGVDV